MQSKYRLLAITVTLLLLVSVFGWAAAQGGTPQAPDEMQGAAFTYQGQLDRSGAPFTGTCDFQFSLWDALSAGTRRGGIQTIGSLSVNQGRFTALLNQGGEFGALPFNGEARWLEIAVQCPGDAAYTALSPRQALTGAPFALSLIHGSRILPAGSGFGLHVSNNQVTSGIDNPIAISASVNQTDFLPGAVGYEDVPVAVRGFTDLGIGLLGIANGPDSVGVYGRTDNLFSYGVVAQNESERGSALLAYNPGGWAGDFRGRADFSSSAPCCDGATLNSRNDSSGIGLWGIAEGTNAGVFGQGGGSGVVGEATANGGIGVVGRLAPGVTSGLAGQFLGNVDVTGSVLAPVTTMRIDHPLDPANQTLSHSSVESPEMKTLYDGIVVTDNQGQAVVQLPDYFEALNRDFRYQLTVIGQFAQAIVAQEIANNQFTIQTNQPNVKVSWQVTGVRHDPYASWQPLVTESQKPADQVGLYWQPQVYGMPAEMGIGYQTAQPPAEMNIQPGEMPQAPQASLPVFMPEQQGAR